MRDTDGAQQLYSPDPVPTDSRALQTFLSRELSKLAFVLNAAARLEKLHVEPLKPRDGMLAYADGTDWDPGSGEGAYLYYGAAWNFLG